LGFFPSELEFLEDYAVPRIPIFEQVSRGDVRRSAYWLYNLEISVTAKRCLGQNDAECGVEFENSGRITPHELGALVHRGTQLRLIWQIGLTRSW